MSRSKEFFLALLITTIISCYALTKCGTYSFKEGKIVVDIGWKDIAAWDGRVVGFCTWCGGPNACCTGAAIVETLLAAVIVTSYDGSKSSVESANINIHH